MIIDGELSRAIGRLSMCSHISRAAIAAEVDRLHDATDPEVAIRIVKLAISVSAMRNISFTDAVERIKDVLRAVAFQENKK